MTNGDIVSYLGEPNIKAGGKLANITLTYKKLGFEVEFYSKVWEAADAPISHVCFFLPEKNYEIICAVCREKTTKRCSRCQIVNYCSRGHQELHWKAHKVFCKKID